MTDQFSRIFSCFFCSVFSRKFSFISLLLSLGAGISLPVSSFAEQTNQAQWSYQDEATKADKWADLSPEYARCSKGKNQSPINIDSKKSLNVMTRGIKFNYGLIVPKSIRNTGKLIQVIVDNSHENPANIKVDGIKFELLRLDIHIPSEHTLDDKHYPMEIEFVHKSKAGQFALVSRMVVPGRPDRTLRKLLQQLPMQKGEAALAANALRNSEMKKKYANYYRYSGSLTTPPCSEGVRWFIMKQPMTFSKQQYEKFRAAVKQDNNRPLQKLNARLILD